MGEPTAPPPTVGPLFKHKSALAMAPGRTRMRTIMGDAESRQNIWDHIANGMQVSELARLNGVPYLVFYRYLREQCGDEYAAARAAYAESLVFKNIALADEIEKGKVAGSEGKAAAGIRQWYAERADSDTWGQKSSMNVHHTGVVGLHMQALRAFNAGQEQEQAVDAEYEEVENVEHDEPTPAPKRHPLL